MKCLGRSYLLYMLVALASKLTAILGGMFALALVLCSGFAIYDTLYVEAAAMEGWDTLQYRPDVIDDPSAGLTASGLAAINEDYRAWVTFYDTNIDYPVVQGEDDLYYASHDVYKQSSLTGAIYLAAANASDFSDSYNLLYGHHMDSGAMLGDIDKYVDEDFFDAHREAVLVSGSEVFDLYVFALVQTDAYEQTIYAAGDRDLSEVLDYARTHALRYDESVSDAGKLLALSTCSSSATNGRLVLLATMTPRNGSVPAAAGAEEAKAANPGTSETDGAATPSNTGTTLGGTFKRLEPRANEGGEGNWALLNLVTMLLTLYFFVPLGDLRAKYRRRRMVKRLADELIAASEQAEAEALEQVQEAEGLALAEEATAEVATAAVAAGPVAASAVSAETYAILSSSDVYLAQDVIDDISKLVKHVTRKFRTGIVLELAIAVAAVVFFFFVTDFRQPMVIINRYTPILIAMLALCWLTDVKLIRFCDYRTPEQNGAAHA